MVYDVVHSELAISPWAVLRWAWVIGPWITLA